MEKLKLNLDDLQVESFETTPEGLGEHRGTIVGYGGITKPVMCDVTVDDPTCLFSCGNTCANTCNSCLYTCTCPVTVVNMIGQVNGGF